MEIPAAAVPVRPAADRAQVTVRTASMRSPLAIAAPEGGVRCFGTARHKGRKSSARADGLRHDHAPNQKDVDRTGHAAGYDVQEGSFTAPALRAAWSSRRLFLVEHMRNAGETMAPRKDVVRPGHRVRSTASVRITPSVIARLRPDGVDEVFPRFQDETGAGEKLDRIGASGRRNRLSIECRLQALAFRRKSVGGTMHASKTAPQGSRRQRRTALGAWRGRRSGSHPVYCVGLMLRRSRYFPSVSVATGGLRDTIPASSAETVPVIFSELSL